MNTKLLFPHSYKKWGWILFSISFIMGVIFLIFWDSDTIEIDFLELRVFGFIHDGFFNHPSPDRKYFSLIRNNVFDELITILLLVSSLLVCFSKLKVEDEYTMEIRTNSLIWATYANVFLVILSTVTIYGLPYLKAMMVFIFLHLILFVVRFHYLLRKLKREGSEL